MKIYNLRIASIEPLPSPASIKKDLPLPEDISNKIIGWREEIVRILAGEDKRLLAIVGPCSIHDPKAALEYARKLKILRDKHEKDLFIMMRVYFEKPRTTIGRVRQRTIGWGHGCKARPTEPRKRRTKMQTSQSSLGETSARAAMAPRAAAMARRARWSVLQTSRRRRCRDA